MTDAEFEEAIAIAQRAIEAGALDDVIWRDGNERHEQASWSWSEECLDFVERLTGVRVVDAGERLWYARVRRSIAANIRSGGPRQIT